MVVVWGDKLCYDSLSVIEEQDYEADSKECCFWDREIFLVVLLSAIKIFVIKLWILKEFTQFYIVYKVLFSIKLNHFWKLKRMKI